MSLIPSLSIFRHRAYLHFWLMRQFVGLARNMEAVAVGWQVYDLARRTRSIEESALLLGMVGLVQFVPVLSLALVGGHAADRYDRKMILVVSNSVRAGASLLLFSTAAFSPSVALPLIFIAAALLGAVNAFTPPAANSFYPRLVPRDELPKAIAWNSLGFQGAAISGPAIGGFLYIGGPQLVYGVASALTVIAVVIIATAKAPRHQPVQGARMGKMVREGLRYVRDNKIVLGAISLDLIVVLFGGATALLPVFARDILDVGSSGLGLLRAAPAAGAVLIGLVLASRPLARRVGAWLLAAVAVYGLATLGFAFSRLFWLSTMALAVTGAADMISVYVRQSLIQLATPDAMRGRISSVSFIFISASNELGEFESGVVARFLGPVGAVVLGGVVALLSAGVWIRLFPALTSVNAFEDASIEVQTT